MKKILIYSLFIVLSTSAYADFFISLSFDDGTLNDGSTGTFSISGSATSSQGGSNGWSSGTSSNNFGGDNLPPNSNLRLVYNSVTNDPGFDFDGNSWSQSVTGTDLLVSNSNNSGDGGIFFSIGGNSTSPVGGLLQIGDGVNDTFSGTFSIIASNGAPGNITPADFEGQQFGSEFVSSDTNVVISTVIVPEPSTYALIIGTASLAFVAVRRHRP